jgi:trimeric autotransporter adhesin
MKNFLFIILTVFISGFAGAQQIYYWVGGTNSLFNTTTNWNTALNGTGTARGSNGTATDILIFDGSNIGGTVQTTGQATVAVNGTITCAQMKFVNNADIILLRSSSGTGTVNISGDGTPDEDLVVASGAKLSFLSTVGSVRVAMVAATTGSCSGTIIYNTGLQARIDNTTAGNTGSFLFKNGSICRTNITAGSASYAFGNSTQSARNWVIFEAGAHLYFDGGFSPHGSSSTSVPNFSAIDMRPGSVWHHRANNAGLGGNFFNRESYGDIIVENNAILTATGSIYRMGNLTVNAGCTFIPHTSGQNVITGNFLVNGDYTNPISPATLVPGTNELVFAGNTPQTVSGTGTIKLGGLVVANNAEVTLGKNIPVSEETDIFGRINFGTNQITDTTSFVAYGIETLTAGTGNLVAGRYFITGNAANAVPYTASSVGRLVSGTGIEPNTSIVSFSTTGDSIYLSLPIATTGAAVALTVSTTGATLQTANTNGFNPAGGSVATTSNMAFGNGLSYVIDAATTSPFGVTTGSSTNMIFTKNIEVNASITVNKAVTVSNTLLINGKMTLRPADTVHILNGGDITGTFGPTKYIATDYVTATGVQSIVQFDGLASVKTIPAGTVNYYLPITITPTSTSSFAVAVFQGITTNGLLNGTPFTALQRLRVVNAVWNVNRLAGTGSADLQLNWDNALEGTTFATLLDADIGLIRHVGSGPAGWANPIGTGNNAANIVMGTTATFGSFGAGAVPQLNAFIYNDLPVKTYGDPDFNGGATSLNTTNPIIYTSNNSLVATIIAGNIHIVGAGTASITASQVGDGVFPDTTATKILTVNKAALEIRADNKSKFELVANPPLTITYTGFVLGETNTVLTTQPAIATTAVLSSAPGTYPITVSGATAVNYDITHVNGTMTVIPKTNQTITFPAPATKTYGNAPFNTLATSTNSTIPITYTSSNTNVATVLGNIITITGGGTTTITAMQAGSDGFFPAPSVARTLTVNKANLTVRAADTSKITGQPNPAFVMVYTGFVLGETAANLATQPVVSTTATTNSSPGLYTLVPGGAVTNNYNITYTNGRLTVLPTTGTSAQYLLAYKNSSGNISVRIYSPVSNLADIYIHSSNGAFIAKKNILINNGFAFADIAARQLAPGIYIVTVKGNGVDLIRRIQL